MGTEEQASEFFQQFGTEDIARISDPRKTLYKALGIGRARASQVLGFRVLGEAVKAYSNGFRQGVTVGDSLQLSGTFLLYKGRIKSAHLAEYAGDEPDFDAVAACAGDVCELRLD